MGEKNETKKMSRAYQKSGRMHLILPFVAHQTSNFRLR